MVGDRHRIGALGNSGQSCFRRYAIHYGFVIESTPRIARPSGRRDGIPAFEFGVLGHARPRHIVVGNRAVLYRRPSRFYGSGLTTRRALVHAPVVGCWQYDVDFFHDRRIGCPYRRRVVDPIEAFAARIVRVSRGPTNRPFSIGEKDGHGYANRKSALVLSLVGMLRLKLPAVTV